MNRTSLQTMYGSTPPSFSRRVEQTLAAGQIQPSPAPRLSLRIILVAALLLMLLTATALAVSSGLVASLFGAHFGAEVRDELLRGDTALSGQSVTLGRVTYTFGELVHTGSGLYGVGRITAPQGITLLPEDTVPDPSRRETECIAVKALAEAVSVDGGAMLALPSVGYELLPREDGSILFMFCLPAGYEVTDGTAYTLQLWCSQCQMTAEGTLPEDAWRGVNWTVTVTSEPARP